MQLEFHQLDRRFEHLRVRPPQCQRRLLASLAESGQQTPIVVVASGYADRYLVIDGYKRIASLQQLGRDTIEAVIWPMGEAEALLLERSLRWSEQETALEQGWLLQEMEQRFGYSLEELARRFDRSVSWVSRRLALVELLPETIQQQVREGRISAHVAMKYLVPVARQNPEDCQRMAAVFSRHRCDTRQAGQLYAAWRESSPSIRKRILDQPELFFKAQREREPKPSAPAIELLRDLEIAAAIVNRASRRLAGVGLDRQQRDEAQGKIDRLQGQLHRMTGKIQQEQEPHAESGAAHHDSGVERARSEETPNRPGVGNLTSKRASGSPLELDRGAGTAASRESRTPPPADSGTFQRLQGEPGAGP